ncbi:hypothetical protein [Evansella halocellulosilytica]|uniref:hypothetical protein n=1 Tax=Evansella halocellulosilytica TaxID=2011013 RepID=UPI000BB98027|nr:hypothetical protein [Evansella halocellulosilytica]
MSGLILESHVNQAKEQTQGSPDRIAQYQTLKNRYREQNADLFDEDNPLPARPSEDYVAQLKTKANESDDPNDMLRYQVVKGRAEAQAEQQSKVESIPALSQELRQRVQADNINEVDLRRAEELARATNDIKDIALYQTIKAKIRAQS